MLHRLLQNRVARNLACAALAISAVGGITVATGGSAQAAPLTPNYPTELYCYSANNKFERLHVWFVGREVWAPSGGVASGGVRYMVEVEYNQKIKGSTARRWNAYGGPKGLRLIPYTPKHFPAASVCATTGYTGGTGIVKW